MPPEKLSDDEMAAWRGFLRAHSTITRNMSRHLEEIEAITLSEYEVLLNLAQRSGTQASMTDLAESVLLTPSGLTRLVDRLAARGYVERTRCGEDRRRSWATLTPTGEAAYRRAGRVHLDDIRRQFVDRLTPTEHATLARLWAKVGAPQLPIRT